MSERSVGHVFDNLFNEYKTNRIIIATFASNVDRVQQIINTAYRFGRKVAVEGRSMVNHNCSRAWIPSHSGSDSD